MIAGSVLVFLEKLLKQIIQINQMNLSEIAIVGLCVR